MGNCFRHDKSAVWDGGDWGSLASKYKHGDEGDDETVHHVRLDGDNSEKKRLLGSGSSDPSRVTREVKLKMSKKELEELMREVNLQGFSLEQVLAKMVTDISGAGESEAEHHRNWQPVLQSIPE